MVRVMDLSKLYQDLLDNITHILRMFLYVSDDNFEVRLDVNTKRDEYAIREYMCASSKNLSLLYPNLAAEWHPTKNGTKAPENVTVQSNQKVWWICEKGHSFDATVSNRVYRNTKCKYCQNEAKKTINSKKKKM